MIPVDSASIAAIGYDDRRNELAVQFCGNGDLYLYRDVPREEYEAFMAAASKGAFLNREFKRRGYRYLIVKDGGRSVA
jgi:hypothetical protein